MAKREDRRRFWRAIAMGCTSEDAGRDAGVAPAVGSRWFREAGGMPPSHLAPGAGAPSFTCRTRGDRAAARPRSRCPGDRASSGPIALDDLAHAAPDCGDPPAAASSIAPRRRSGTPRELADDRVRRGSSVMPTCVATSRIALPKRSLIPTAIHCPTGACKACCRKGARWWCGQTRFTMLLHLPPMPGHRRGPRAKNGPALAGRGAEAVRDAIVATITTLPAHPRRSLTWE